MRRRRGTFSLISVITIFCAAVQIPWVSTSPSESPASLTTAATTDHVSGTGSLNLGEPCTETQQCATSGAECVGTCQCAPDTPITNHVDKCDKAAKLNESCTFDEQCEAGTEMTKCQNNLCTCRYEMMPLIIQDGSLQCSAQGNSLLNEDCTVNTDCGTNGAICVNAVCKCHDNLTATDNHNRCGKERSVNQSCTFDEQCTLTAKTECRDGQCKCEKNRILYPDNEAVLRCLKRGDAGFGDSCNDTLMCGFDGAICVGSGQRKTCQCAPDIPVTDGLSKCGRAAYINESCSFNEQCEVGIAMTECKENRCQCRFQMVAIVEKDGTTKCTNKGSEPREGPKVDPAMIGVLVGMGLMFIILCVVLRLFSKARWRENRTIFNTPNPRLMNVSLLRDSKLMHGAERRGSKASVRAPSRQPSMASLRPQSPSQSIGSRRSRGSSSPSVTSTKSPKSPTKPSANNVANNTGASILENVTVEVQDPKV